MYLQESRMEDEDEREERRKRKVEYMTSCNKGIKGRKKDCHNLRAKKSKQSNFERHENKVRTRFRKE